MIVYETAADYVQPLHQRSCKGWETRKAFRSRRLQGSEIAGTNRNTRCGRKLAENGTSEIFRVKRSANSCDYEQGNKTHTKNARSHRTPECRGACALSIFALKPNAQASTSHVPK